MAASSEDWSWINAQRLFFARPITREWVDPVQLAEAIGLICNLRSFEAIGPDRDYLHRSGMVLLGDTAITTAAFLPQQGRTEDFDQCLVELPLADGSGTCFSIEGRDYQCQGGNLGLFLSGQAMHAITARPTATLGYNLDPHRLTDLLVQLSAGSMTEEQARLELQRPHLINLRDPRVGELWQWLQSLLQMVESSPMARAEPQGELALALEELLYRSSLLMIRPDLIELSPLSMSPPVVAPTLST